jgi:hypothetical protein
MHMTMHLWPVRRVAGLSLSRSLTLVYLYVDHHVRAFACNVVHPHALTCMLLAANKTGPPTQQGCDSHMAEDS